MRSPALFLRFFQAALVAAYAVLWALVPRIATAASPSEGQLLCEAPYRLQAKPFPQALLEFNKTAREIARAVEGTDVDELWGRVTTGFLLHFMERTDCKGTDVVLEYVQPVLRVARELSACQFQVVKEHETHHLDIYRSIVRDFVALRPPVSAMSSKAAMEAYARQRVRDMQARNLAYDREDYPRLKERCPP